MVALGEHGVALAQTLFYPTGGGQPGDSGQLTLPDGTQVRVSGTVRDAQERGVIWHQVEAVPGLIHVGMEVQGTIDWVRRYQHMKMHTCLHLLCAILAAPVTGCSIGEEKGRLDFDLPEMTTDKETITAALRAYPSRGRQS